MKRFVSFGLICLLALTCVSFAKTEAIDPTGKCDAMYYSNTDAFGDVVRTIPSVNPGPSNAWVGISWANGELLQFKNVASPTSSQMLRINPNTGAVIATVTLAYPTPGYMMEGTFDGTNLWCCQWYPSGGIHQMAMDGSYISSITPAITGSPRAITYDGTNLWVGTNTGSNVTNLYKMTTGGSIISSWVTNSVVGWYMGFDWLFDAPPGGELCLVDNVGNTIKRLLISGATVSIANQVASPAVSPDVAEGLGYDGDHMTHCGAYASLGVVWFIDDGFVPANPYAPAAPTNFTVANNGAALIASLAWTLPTQTVNGNPLNPNYPITSVRVKRNNVVIANLPATATSYNDNVPAVGSYEYKVYARNDSGDGLPATASAWIGLDVPAAPSNVTAAMVGANVNVTWTAPTQGAHNGYWPPLSWTGQRVYRNGTQIANLPGTNTNYSDTPPGTGTYTYGVAYYNSSGDGPTGNATPIFLSTDYTFQTIAYNWVEINPAHPGGYSGTNTGLASDDQNLGPFNIGFTFPFFGTAFTQFRVCTNGFASFTSTATVYTNVQIPNTVEPNNLLAVYWDDMNFTPPTSYGSAWYYYDAPGNRCIIEWDSVAHYGTTPGGNYTFEIILHSNGEIDYQYKAMVPGLANDETVGLENASASNYFPVYYNGSGIFTPSAHSACKFTPIGGGVTWDVNISPVNPPIVIPAEGDTFQYNINVHNLGTIPATCYVWNKVRASNGNYYNAFGPISRTLPGGANPTRIFSQIIPGNIPSGTCYYISYIGPNTTTIEDTSFFTFTKSATMNGGPWISEFAGYGDFFDEFAVATTPSDYRLDRAFPNPFNPTTTISFTLANAGAVKLVVFDVTGREVATMVNGYRAAGSHSVTFDASNLASGVYIYRLTAGEFNASGKMVLMK